ncbi:MAG: S-methyl-5'-thioinosine phosphorylase [Natronospirillum sp.]|uniref:S-methyl-5'-thioinosine phosphorylase n=1 Tax=Natronospirillum sp. TaxID=2812955 RepID=UPI0025FF297C|nr:S-methyl-5'-thioinosine phosphorylase [Natronospirillum sp.]MCH8553420.1 S-methyl-5'-thioinosine phosphorylase [Natronospirillum sp.]
MTRTIAILGGTGLTEPSRLQVINAHDVQTPYGNTSAPILEGDMGGHRVLFMARHGHPHRIAPHQVNYRANLWALQKLYATDIVSVNAVGSISIDRMPTRSLVLPDQIIDYTWGRIHTYYQGDLESVKHVDLSYPYTDSLRDVLRRAARESGKTIADGGVYGVTQGPRLETAAEIVRMERDGCDIVGMTGMPEAALARELKLNYASLALVVNPAAGKSSKVITLKDIQATLAVGMVDVRDVVSEAVRIFYED